MRRAWFVQVLGSVISGFAMSLGRWSWAQVPGTSPGAPLPGDGTAVSTTDASLRLMLRSIAAIVGVVLLLRTGASKPWHRRGEYR